jgi:hypothetical protein
MPLSPDVADRADAGRPSIGVAWIGCAGDFCCRPFRHRYRPRDGAATPKESGAALTLKERLGAKWKDEQRVNNCKVPPEKRGSKPRPDRCDHPPTE